MSRSQPPFATTPTTDPAFFRLGLAMHCAPVWSVGSCRPINIEPESHCHVCPSTPVTHAVQAASGRPAQPVAEDHHPENPDRSAAVTPLRPLGSDLRRGFGHLYRRPPAIGLAGDRMFLIYLIKTLTTENSASAKSSFSNEEFLRMYLPDPTRPAQVVPVPSRSVFPPLDRRCNRCACRQHLTEPKRQPSLGARPSLKQSHPNGSDFQRGPGCLHRRGR